MCPCRNVYLALMSKYHLSIYPRSTVNIVQTVGTILLSRIHTIDDVLQATAPDKRKTIGSQHSSHTNAYFRNDHNRNRRIMERFSCGKKESFEQSPERLSLADLQRAEACGLSFLVQRRSICQAATQSVPNKLGKARVMSNHHVTKKTRSRQNT